MFKSFQNLFTFTEKSKFCKKKIVLDSSVKKVERKKVIKYIDLKIVILLFLNY